MQLQPLATLDNQPLRGHFAARVRPVTIHLMDQIRLSPYGRSSARPSPVNRMMATFASDFRPGVDINLGVGYVSEEAIPRQRISQAYQRVLSEPQRYAGALNYGPPAGLLCLIDTIRHRYAQRLDANILAQKRIIIGASGATSLLEAAGRILRPGIVITSDPVYYIYTDLLKRLGFELLAIPEDQEGINTNDIEKKLEDLGPRVAEISFFYLVTVTNPTCTVLSNTRRRDLVKLVTRLSERLGRRVPLLLDTAYESLIHDQSVGRLESGLAQDPLGLVYEIGSVSKIIAPALRVGYLIGQEGPFMAAMVQNASDTTLGPPPLNQYVAADLLNSRRSDAHTTYTGKAKQVRAWLDRDLASHLVDVRGGQAGFYFYLTFKLTATHERSTFFQFLTRTTGDASIDRPSGTVPPRVIYLPGEYCVYRQGELVDLAQRQLRISYAYENLTQIQHAIKLMTQAIAYAASRQNE